MKLYIRALTSVSVDYSRLLFATRFIRSVSRLVICLVSTTAFGTLSYATDNFGRTVGHEGILMLRQMSYFVKTVDVTR